MAITPTDFHTGSIFARDGVLWQVIEFQHVKPGKGPAFVRCKIKNLRTGALVEEKLRPDVKLEEVRVEPQDGLPVPAGRLPGGDGQENFERANLPRTCGKQLSLLIENEELNVAMNGNEAISAELPLTVCEVTAANRESAAIHYQATKGATVEGDGDQCPAVRQPGRPTQDRHPQLQLPRARTGLKQVANCYQMYDNRSLSGNMRLVAHEGWCVDGG
jgi:translation elongation factor P/translation initiation factor 5A